MSFDVKEIYEYGTGLLNDITISDGAFEKVNSYARVIEIGEKFITIDTDNLLEGDFETFRAGIDILIHISASPIETDKLGRYLVAKILLANRGVLELDKDFSKILPPDELDKYYVQAITFANFDCLTLEKDGIITPPVYSPANFCGGILCIKCFDKLIFNGGHISLTNCGIPARRKNFLRPIIASETAANGESDTAIFAGQENTITKDKFLLNAGDGAAFIVVDDLVINEGNSRIGDVDFQGEQFFRGWSKNPETVTNVGGSSILIVARTIKNFTPKIISKYRNAKLDEGRGLARCYIASKTKLRNDEGLYAYDVIHDPLRLSKELNIYNFGNGSFNSVINPNYPLNNYAKVIEISNNGHKLFYTNKTVNGLAPIQKGSKVLVQMIQQGNNFNPDYAGKIILATVIADDGESLTLDFPVPCPISENLSAQIISIPQFENFTLQKNYTETTKFNSLVGGVFAIIVEKTCDIRGGKINVEGKGGAYPYGREGLAKIGNAQDCDKLPLGAGHGSVFILANKIVADENTRIGATYNGEISDKTFGGQNFDGTNRGGGYSGAEDEDGKGSGGGYNGGGAYPSGIHTGGFGGSGAGGGTSDQIIEFNRTCEFGGYGSNGASKIGKGGLQGAHILLIADKIDGLNQSAISTGGEGAEGALPGAAGFGGGANLVSSGGGAGWAFAYFNEEF